MKYFKLFLMWLSFIMAITLFGDLVISQNVNGFLQLIGFGGFGGGSSGGGGAGGEW